ncbi:MAG TPA: hypothetical protein VK567_07300, partial [Bradyrhizobium sp.]|nr:hypothetical protein [Bradyrhizobium sp.]
RQVNRAFSSLKSPLDWTTSLPGSYDMAFFLGILYHLKNPCLVRLRQCEPAGASQVIDFA